MSENNIFSRNVYIAGNAALEEAIKEFNREVDEGKGDIFKIFALMSSQMRDDVEVITPVDFPEGLPSLNDAQIDQLNQGEDVTGTTAMVFQKIENDEGQLFMVAFTSEPEATRGPESSSIPILMKELFEIALEEECEGIVFNPFGESLPILKPGLEAALALMEPPTQDMLDLDAGAEAYNRGDFAKAVELYTKAAQAGNVTAMSNLGYCYYYGRSIPVDKAKAQECWTRAALMGDICATYKLGDMYRNGDLPLDENFAKALYRKAFAMAADAMDIYCTPDAFLRVLKYCSDDFETEALAEIADKCREGFQARVDDGDRYTDKLLEEAKALCEKYGVDKTTDPKLN